MPKIDRALRLERGEEGGYISELPEIWRLERSAVDEERSVGTHSIRFGKTYLETRIRV
jgi:hypothetical protein